MLTLSVPQLGSAVKTNATVYMGHRLAKPAVESVTLHGRYAMTIRFNQAVGRAEDLTCYSIQSEDIWGWHVKLNRPLPARTAEVFRCTPSRCTREPIPLS